MIIAQPSNGNEINKKYTVFEFKSVMIVNARSIIERLKIHVIIVGDLNNDFFHLTNIIECTEY